MTDFARRGKAARAKGARGEREIVDLLREYGFVTAHRNFMSGGAGGGDITDAIPNVHLEVKRCENVSLSAWWRQATASARPTDTTVIVHRGSSQPWQASGLLQDFTPILEFQSVMPKVIGRGGPRPDFLAQLRDMRFVAATPCVVHQCGEFAMATVLFDTFLEWQSSVCQTERAA